MAIQRPPLWLWPWLHVHHPPTPSGAKAQLSAKGQQPRTAPWPERMISSAMTG
jgi:hypothetical protein